MIRISDKISTEIFSKLEVGININLQTDMKNMNRISQEKYILSIGVEIIE
jgi:hypothetical protein